MQDVQHVNMEFGDQSQLRTRNKYTVDQAREIQEIVVMAVDVALKAGRSLVPGPVTEPSQQ